MNGAAVEDRRIRGLRPPKPRSNEAPPPIIEEERRPDGRIERALTAFLTGAECPFTCSFCDLWKWTLDGPTPPGALVVQLERILTEVDGARPDRLKLYNASNFFDRRAVPEKDLPRIAQLASPFAGVTVESHASTVGRATLEFARRLPGRLEIAMGLETIHPVASQHLNKRLDLERFDRAADFLREHEMDLRVFVLLGAPYVAPDEAVEWVVRTVEYAASRGAAVVSIIPVRRGNGEIERLEAAGHFTPPTLRELEEALEACLKGGGKQIPRFARDDNGTVVTADLWDIGLLATCDACRAARIERMQRMNITGRPDARAACGSCGE